MNSISLEITLFHYPNDAAPHFLRNLPLSSGLDGFGINCFDEFDCSTLKLKLVDWVGLKRVRKGLARISYGE